MRFITPTDSTLEITKAAIELLQQIYRNGYGYKKSGISLSEITPCTAMQGELFDTIDRPKHRKLMETIDRINASQGPHAIKLVSQGKITDHTNRQFLSPQYTTSWDDILVINV
jgi:DNA polymerase V